MNENDNQPNIAPEQGRERLSKGDADSAPEFTPREPHHNPIGAIIGSVILFALLILGALYTYGRMLSVEERNTTGADEEQTDEFILEKNDQSDDLEALEDELSALEDFENMGADLEGSFDAEFSE